MSDEDKNNEDRPELDLPDAEDSVEGEPELDEWWSWGNFARLFIFPLIIVVVSVVIYGTFQMMLQNPTTIKQYISQIRNGPENERWRAAYSLAQAVKKRDAQKKLTRSSVDSIIKLYKSAEHPKIRQYLALVLAEVPVEQSIEALITGLNSDNPGVKVNTTLAIGQLFEKADGSIIETKIQSSALQLAELLNDDSSKVRRMAAFVLGSLGNKEAIDPLKSTLNDSSKEVRWNGAIALGQLGSPAGKSTLLNVLEKALNKEFSDLEPSLRRNLLTNAIQALAKLNARSALPQLKRIKEEDQDSKVRKDALEAIKKLGKS